MPFPPRTPPRPAATIDKSRCARVCALGARAAPSALPLPTAHVPRKALRLLPAGRVLGLPASGARAAVQASRLQTATGRRGNGRDSPPSPARSDPRWPRAPEAHAAARLPADVTASARPASAAGGLTSPAWGPALGAFVPGSAAVRAARPSSRSSKTCPLL